MPPTKQDQSTENLIRRAEAAEDVATLKDVLVETLTLLMMVCVAHYRDTILTVGLGLLAGSPAI